MLALSNVARPYPGRRRDGCQRVSTKLRCCDVGRARPAYHLSDSRRIRLSLNQLQLCQIRGLAVSAASVLCRFAIESLVASAALRHLDCCTCGRARRARHSRTPNVRSKASCCGFRKPNLFRRTDCMSVQTNMSFCSPAARSGRSTVVRKR